MVLPLTVKKNNTFKKAMKQKLVHDSTFSTGLSSKIPIREYFSPQFIQHMVNAMIFAHHKYHSTPKEKLTFLHKTKQHDKINALGNLQTRIEKYVADGNTEWLVDVANMAMIEFMFPSHPKAHFRPTGSEESPGLVDYEGERIHGL